MFTLFPTVFIFFESAGFVLALETLVEFLAAAITSVFREGGTSGVETFTSSPWHTMLSSTMMHRSPLAEEE